MSWKMKTWVNIKNVVVDIKNMWYIKDIKKGNRFIRVDELYQKKIEILPNERTFTEKY